MDLQPYRLPGSPAEKNKGQMNGLPRHPPCSLNLFAAFRVRYLSRITVAGGGM